jgi:hypothetical protein
MLAKPDSFIMDVINIQPSGHTYESWQGIIMLDQSNSSFPTIAQETAAQQTL